MFHVYVFGSLFDLWDLFLPGFLRHEINLEYYVVSVLSSDDWWVSLFVRIFTSQVYPYWIWQVRTGLNFAFLGFFILQLLSILFGLTLTVLFHDGRYWCFKGLIHFVFIFDGLQAQLVLIGKDRVYFAYLEKAHVSGRSNNLLDFALAFTGEFGWFSFFLHNQWRRSRKFWRLLGLLNLVLVDLKVVRLTLRPRCHLAANLK